MKTWIFTVALSASLRTACAECNKWCTPTYEPSETSLTDLRTVRCPAANENIAPFAFSKLLPHAGGGACRFGAEFSRVQAINDLLKKSSIETLKDSLEQVQGLLDPSSLLKYIDPIARFKEFPGLEPPAFYCIEKPAEITTSVMAFELLEVYAYRLLGTVPFESFPTAPTVLTIVAALNNVAQNNMAVRELVTKNRITDAQGNLYWRSLLIGKNYLGVKEGPVQSQFFMLPSIMEVQWQEQMYYRETGPGPVDMAMYLAVDGGQVPYRRLPDTSQAYPMCTYESLATIVHSDVLYAMYHKTLHMLLRSNLVKPYPLNDFMVPFPTDVGCQAYEGLFGEGTRYAVVVGFAAKYAVSRARPEEMAYLFEQLRGGCPAGDSECEAVREMAAEWEDVVQQGSDLLNMMGNSYLMDYFYREGSPSHPSYPGGHSVFAGAGVTLMKLFFDVYKDRTTSPPTLMPWSDLRFYESEFSQADLQAMFAKLVNYQGANSLSYLPEEVYVCNTAGTGYVPDTGDVSGMSVVGELHKLASWYTHARDAAGVHYASDGIAGIELGEKAALQFMWHKLVEYVAARADPAWGKEGLMCPLLDGRHVRVTTDGFYLYSAAGWKYVSKNANDLYPDDTDLVCLGKPSDPKCCDPPICTDPESMPNDVATAKELGADQALSDLQEKVALGAPAPAPAAVLGSAAPALVGAAAVALAVAMAVLAGGRWPLGPAVSGIVAGGSRRNSADEAGRQPGLLEAAVALGE